MTHPVPSGYRGPADPGRDHHQAWQDATAQNLIHQLIVLHEALWEKLTGYINHAAMDPSDPESGHVTGSNSGDRMDARAQAVRQAEAERGRQMKNARQELRRAVEWYERQLGMRPPRRARVESIDYLDGAQRRVG